MQHIEGSTLLCGARGICNTTIDYFLVVVMSLSLVTVATAVPGGVPDQRSAAHQPDGQLYRPLGRDRRLV